MVLKLETNTERNGLSSTPPITGVMRHFRRRKTNPYRGRKRIPHKVSEMTIAPTTGNSAEKIFANAGAFNTVGTALTTVAASISNKEQENTVGSAIGRMTVELVFRGATGNGVWEIAFWKVERAASVPTQAVLLPPDTSTSAIGIQSAFAQYLPGRMILHSFVAIAAEQPTIRKYTLDWKKFNLGTVRAGDFYGCTLFNRGVTNGKVDVHCRYNEWV